MKGAKNPAFQMTTYPSHFSQSLGNHGAMAYLKASPTYHMNGLSALGMSHGLDSLQSQSLHYGGGKNNKPENAYEPSRVSLSVY